MSAELPGLERLLADAAERHYGARRPRLPRLPRPAVVARLAAVAAAVALAVAILPLGSDEQTAAPKPQTSDPAAPLADRYAVFARPDEHRADVGVDILESHRDALDMTRGYSSWLLRESADGKVVALAGTARNGEPSLCLWDEVPSGGSGGCAGIADLLGDFQPWVLTGFVAGTGYTVTALVPDDVTSFSVALKGGANRDVEIENNLAYATADRPICEVTWTTSDGTSTSQSGESFDAVGSDTSEPQPPSC